MTLGADDFSAFFHEVYGYEPFPWQKRLLRQLAEDGQWPDVLDLPTGSGKTAAIDIAVFHLALEAGHGSERRRAPVRIAFVVDRRLVVDDAFTRAETLAKKLREARDGLAARVAERLKSLSGDGPPLIARRLRGGIPRESDWARTPSQPTVLCSTVDQVGSRLLFRGYGVSDRMKPVHAGLIGSDCLILLDEAHLAEPFRQTLGWVRMYQGRNWREIEASAPWGFALLTATPGGSKDDLFPAGDPFPLDDDDRAHPILKKRLGAAKPARLVGPAKSKAGGEDTGNSEEDADGRGEDARRRAAVLTERVQAALRHSYGFQDVAGFPAIGVVVNRVARARAVFESLRKTLTDEDAVMILLIGAARPVERDELAGRLKPIRTGNGIRRTLDKPLILVATQCIEAGVDIDLDALITEAAPLGALRQRFGRLNRDGRPITPYAAIVAAKVDLGKNDPVYGDAIKPSWEGLLAASRKKGGEAIVDFGIDDFSVEFRPEALSKMDDAPVLLPAHLDLLSQTWPVPAADPEVALYLHGDKRQPDAVTVLWRADLDPRAQGGDDVRGLLTLVPPRPGEAIELPVWTVRRWLSGQSEGQGELADIAGVANGNDAPLRGGRGELGRVFRWKGNDDERSQWIRAGDVRPGDCIVVPAAYGGVDMYGWNPRSTDAATDVARDAAQPFFGRSFAVRVAPGLLEDTVSAEALADALASAASERWDDLHAAVQTLALPEGIRKDLDRLDSVKSGKKSKVIAYTDLYGEDGEQRPRGVVFVAPFGITVDAADGVAADSGAANSTEDDAAGSTPGYALSLARHSADVESRAEASAASAGLPVDRINDLKVAGYLHDAGKADLRFQAWLNYGDPFGPDLDEAGTILAKSGRRLPRLARERSGLPEHWRHEALSVRLAAHSGRLVEASDRELVLWLLGTHHGYGRPLFPHEDPDDAKPRMVPAVDGGRFEMPPGAGPQSLAFDWKGLDWPSLFVRLKERYGVWELARMEAILRLADHRASEERAKAAAEDS